MVVGLWTFCVFQYFPDKTIGIRGPDTLAVPLNMGQKTSSLTLSSFPQTFHKRPGHTFVCPRKLLWLMRKNEVKVVSKEWVREGHRRLSTTTEVGSEARQYFRRPYQNIWHVPPKIPPITPTSPTKKLRVLVTSQTWK